MRKRLGILDWWSSFKRFKTNRKLSWMHLFLNAFRLLEIISPKISARQFARSLEKIWERLWMRLMDW